MVFEQNSHVSQQIRGCRNSGNFIAKGRKDLTDQVKVEGTQTK